jgi:sirohydrochlorin ferrochelatase
MAPRWATVLDAVEQAVHDRRPRKGVGLVHHSDQDSRGDFNLALQHLFEGGWHGETEVRGGAACESRNARARASRGGAP